LGSPLSPAFRRAPRRPGAKVEQLPYRPRAQKARGFLFCGQKPFPTVYWTGTICAKKERIRMSQFLEACMVISFGISWPISIMKSLKSRTAKGKSIIFILFVLFGYACGIASKLTAGKITYVFIFYVINFFMVAFDGLLYLRNSKLDREAEIAAEAEKQR
jgi:hypothetical protein